MKEIAFFTGISMSDVAMLMDKFENEYQMIKYNKNTHEIAIVHWAKYNMNKLGGKPIIDCISSELKRVDDVSLLKVILVDITREEIRELFLREIKEREDREGKKEVEGGEGKEERAGRKEVGESVGREERARKKEVEESVGRENRAERKDVGESKGNEEREGREEIRGSKKDKPGTEMNKKGEGKKYGLGVYSKGKFASSVKGEDDSLYEKPSEEQLRKIKELYS